MQRQDCTFLGPEGQFHFINWGGDGPLAHFAHATGLCAGVYTPLANILRSQLNISGMDDRGHGQTRVPANPDRLSSWQDGFLEAYISDGTEKTLQGEVRLCCEPAWESKCFSVCPHDIWRYVPQIKLPVLVLYGASSDTFLATAVKRFQSKVPHARFKCFEKSGHFVPMEQPEATAEAIFDFLQAEALM